MASLGAPVVFDPPAGQWAEPPAFPSGGGGLVSTIDDLHAFGRMLLAGGRLPNGEHLISRAAVEAMTTDQLGVLGGAASPAPDGALGWGFGVGVQVRRTGLGPTVGGYGWTGGLGSSWSNDPNRDLVGVDDLGHRERPEHWPGGLSGFGQRPDRRRSRTGTCTPLDDLGGAAGIGGGTRRRVCRGPDRAPVRGRGGTG